MSEIYFNNLDKKFEYIVAAARRSRELPRPINRNEGLRFSKRTVNAIKDLNSGKTLIEDMNKKIILDLEKNDK